jgi:hypothetical protein
LLCSGCDLDPTWQRYVDRRAGFSVSIPRFWEKKESANGVLLIREKRRDSADKYSENITILVNIFEKDVSLSKFVEVNKNELIATLHNFYNLEEGDIDAGFVKGKWLSFDGKMLDNLEVRVLSAVWVKGDMAYVVTSTCDKKDYFRYRPIFRKVMQSFRVLK